MSAKAKKGIKLIAGLAVVAAMLLILYFLFKDSYKDIAKQLAQTNLFILAGMVVLGNMYYLIDAILYSYLLRREGHPMSFRACTAVAYMCVFFNVTTFGAGIKPAQVIYLHSKGIDSGRGFAITAMPYVFHKTVIVVYALVMLAFNNAFVIRNFSQTFIYIYLGAGLSVAIIVCMILMCEAKGFHNFVLKIIDFIFKSERFDGMKQGLRRWAESLREGTKDIIKSPKAWVNFSLMNILKMTCWYVIPMIAIYASGGTMNGVTFGQALTATALMQLVMGVIPTSGGVGSLEVVFSLIFAAVFGKVLAGSSVVLYRLSTYYIPFLVSIVVMLIVGRDIKKSKAEMKNEKRQKRGCAEDE
ncbi:MAG: flippase-like domain-containing protein [Butyrivibrio sp.]|nr:flippase-like domain-containing protein [Butyrivibrio sp.]